MNYDWSQYYSTKVNPRYESIAKNAATSAKVFENTGAIKSIKGTGALGGVGAIATGADALYDRAVNFFSPEHSAFLNTLGKGGVRDVNREITNGTYGPNPDVSEMHGLPGSNVAKQQFLNQQQANNLASNFASFAPVEGTDGFGNPNNLPDIGLNSAQNGQQANALRDTNAWRSKYGLPSIDGKGNVMEVGAGTVLMTPQQGAPQANQGLSMFGTDATSNTPISYGVAPAKPTTMEGFQGMVGTTQDGIAGPKTFAAAQRMGQEDLYAQLATQAAADNSIDHYNPMEDATMGQPVNASNAMAVDPLKDVKDIGGGSSWFSSMNDSIGKFVNGDTKQFMEVDGKQVKNSDWLSTGDIYSGALSAFGTGINAYGMFEQLDMMGEQVDQGWANVNLKRDAFNEEKRRHNAGAERNKRV